MPKKRKGGRPRLRDRPKNPTMAEDEPQPQTLEDPPPQPPEDAPPDPAAANLVGEEPQEPAGEGPQDPTVPDLPSPVPPQPSAEKLALLRSNLRPIPFAPKKPLDLSAHESLFRALGLWDFARLDLDRDRDLRSDLLSLLIASYDPSAGASFVHDGRFLVTSADLAQALKLDDGSSEELELFKREESVAAVQDFMESYILFEDLEDEMCVVSPEVAKARDLVREGLPHMVDWAGLIWGLVEKELVEIPKSGCCRYASHLQCLMKCQQPWLFDKDAETEAEVERESPVESLAEEENNAGNGGKVKMMSLEDFQDVGMENHEQGLSLGLCGNEDLVNGVEGCKKSEDELWVDEGKNKVFDHCLQRCSSNDVKGMEFEDLCKGGQEGRDEERYDEDFSAKFSNFERLNSTDLLQAMESVHVPYSPHMNSLDPSNVDLLSTRADDHKNLMVDSGPGTSLFLGNNGKRHIDSIDNDEDGIHQLPQHNQQKRMRTDGIWDQTPPSFHTYMEHIQQSVGKAELLYKEKEEACMDAHMQLQFLNEVLQEKDQVIQSIEKSRVEEQQKWQQAVSQYERELNVMADVMFGYKSALRETRRRFAEYREKCKQEPEPLYSDVVGEGGLVLSCRELERQRMEKEAETRQRVLDMIENFQTGWLAKFNAYYECISMLHGKLMELDEEIVQMKHLKERLVESKQSDA